jgi:hypothetical protein
LRRRRRRQEEEPHCRTVRSWGEEGEVIG